MPVDLTDVSHVIESAQKGDEQPFASFLETIYQKLKPQLLSLTKSEEDTKEIFIISMQKFWERFVINQETLPHNSTGYIYMMCKNAWLMQKRKVSSTMIIQEDFTNYSNEEGVIHITDSENLETLEDEKSLQHEALKLAMDSLSDKCKELMENELDVKQKLKDLQEKLGYQNYQALVQAKYNCKKRLVKKVYKLLEQLQNQRTKKYK